MIPHVSYRIAFPEQVGLWAMAGGGKEKGKKNLTPAPGAVGGECPANKGACDQAELVD